MKKMIAYALPAALALSLCACAGSGEAISGTGSESGTEFAWVADPFGGKNEAETENEGSGKNEAESESGETASEEDDGFNYLREMGFSEDYIDHDRHRISGSLIENVLVKAGDEIYGNEPVIYRGGELEISFTMTPHSYADDYAAGYLAFIDGTSQLLSVDGSKPSAMVVFEGKNGESQECTIRLTPRLAKESIAKEDDLTLTLIKFSNPLYKPFGTVAHFDPGQMWSPFAHIPFRLEGGCETVESVPGKAFEHFRGRNPELSKYFAAQNSGRLRDFENDGGGFCFELCSETGAKPVIKDGKADMMLVLYGGEPLGIVNYKVYLYVNYEPVKIDGCDYLTAKWKEGFVAKYSFTMDHLKEDDYVYALAFAENEEACHYDERVITTGIRRLRAAE